MNPSKPKTAAKAGLQHQSSTPRKVVGKPFKPGESGNPSGKRNHTPSLRAALKRTATRSDCEAVAGKLVALAKRGNIRAARLLAELFGDLTKSGVAIELAAAQRDTETIITWPHEKPTIVNFIIPDNGRELHHPAPEIPPGN